MRENRTLASSKQIQMLTLLGGVLALSGAAGLINQVVWQRSLKFLLGGGEALSSTIVVLVFMVGLGLGSWWCGKMMHKIKNPVKVFVLLELLLGVVNLVVAWLLSRDLSTSIFTVHGLASSLGISLYIIYALGALILLFIPCFLMGATMPLAAEICQSKLGCANSRVISILLAINTLGSVVGAIVAGSVMMPVLGLQTSLNIAALLNLLGGGGLLVLLRQNSKYKSTVGSQKEKRIVSEGGNLLSSGCWAILILSFISLSYEMYLFRIFSLRFFPLPQTFSAVITGFLLFWSIGAALSSWARGPSIFHAVIFGGMSMALVLLVSLEEVFVDFTYNQSPILHVSAILVGSLLLYTILRCFFQISQKYKRYEMILVFYLCLNVIAETFVEQSSIVESNYVIELLFSVLKKSVYFIPCLFFGYLFGRITESVSKSWGADLGKVYMFSTVGSCLGIVVLTFVGYYLPHFLIVIVLVTILLSLLSFTRQLDARSNNISRNWRIVFPIMLAGLFVVCGLVFDVSKIIPGYRRICGKDGVIKIMDDGNMIWDGLWHSALSKNNSHVGSKNWYVATIPVMCHSEYQKIKDVCVIGTGTGITASTFAKLDTVEEVVAYDLNRSLKTVFTDYPEGTLGFNRNEKIRMVWQDARAGLTLNEKKYDVIQTQPLYLKQAGSSILNSVEFFELIKSRLKSNGIFCLYSNGTPEQAFLIRETADKVFRYRETFFGGYMVLLSDEPMQYKLLQHQRIEEENSPFWKEILTFKETAKVEDRMKLIDHPKLRAGRGKLIVSDDRPILEYPALIRFLYLDSVSK